MKTKLFTLLLAVVASVGTILAWDYERVQIGDLYYNLDATNQTAEVTSQNSSSPRWSTSITTANIPSSVEYNSVTYSVTSIGSWAFRNCAGLTSVTIPNSVTSIGKCAFQGCSSLRSVTIKSGVTSIGNAAFESCTDLTSVSLGSRVKSIGSSAFYRCSNLTSIILPTSVTSIGKEAFRYCTKLTSIAIPNGVTSIEDGTFYGCTSLRSVTIFDNNVTSIGENAFYGCTGLNTIRIPNSVTNIGTDAFKGCTNITTVIWNAINCNSWNFGSQVTTFTFGEQVESIPTSICMGMNKLTSIVIPESVTSIGTDAFSGCTNITTVTVNSNAVAGSEYTSTHNIGTIFGSQVQTYNLRDAITAIGDYAFYNNNIGALTIPTNVTRIGNSAFEGCTYVASFVIPENVTNIGDNAFRACPGVETLNLPNVTTIGNGAFADCTGLTSLQFGNSLLSIGDSAFSSCYNIAAVEFPTSLQTMGNSAFYQCNRIPNAIIPENVTFLGQSAFKACTNLQSAVIPENVTSIEESMFYGCTALASVSLPRTITAIKDNAFANCSSLTSIAIPASLTTIGENAFNECSGIAEVKIDDLLAWCKIDFANSKSNPLFYAHNLYLGDTLATKLEIPNKVTELKWTFINCSSVQSVVIPNTVRTFSANAFQGCENITSVEWHAKNIADYASAAASPFYDSRNKITSFVFGEETEHVPAYLCSEMKGINPLAFPSYLKSVGDYAFKGLTKIRQINLPNEVTAIGAHAFDSCFLVNSIYLGYQVEEIGDYAFKGCIRVNDITSMNTTTPVVYENTLSAISSLAYLYVPIGSKRTYQLDPYWGRFDIHEIATEEATLTKDSVTVIANEDNAIFAWPTSNDADSYSLQITKDGEVFCTLVFNSNGQLIGIAFAPSRDGASQAPAATTSVAGMSFTVTGLTSASKYAYHLAVTDENDSAIQSYSGEFATTGYQGEVTPGGQPEIDPISTSLDQTTIDKAPMATKFIRNGILYIERDGKTYSVQGQEVK